MSLCRVSALLLPSFFFLSLSFWTRLSAPLLFSLPLSLSLSFSPSHHRHSSSTAASGSIHSAPHLSLDSSFPSSHRCTRPPHSSEPYCVFLVQAPKVLRVSSRLKLSHSSTSAASCYPKNTPFCLLLSHPSPVHVQHTRMPSFQLSLGHSRAKVLLCLALIFTVLVFTWSSDSADLSLTTPIARPTPRVQGPYLGPPEKRQDIDPLVDPLQSNSTGVASSASPTVSSAASPTSTVASSPTSTATAAPTTLTTSSRDRTTDAAAATSSTLSFSTTSQSLNTTGTSTSSPSPSSSDSNSGLIIGGAAVGGLVFAIGIALIAFKCTMNKKDRHRRDKEFAATMALDNRIDPILSPRKGYVELGEDPPIPGSGRLTAASLSRQGSQDAYYLEHGQGYSSHGSDVGAGDYYNQHYVQECYGGAPGGHHGMYEETELSVIGGHSGRANVAYPPSTVPSSHYGGYDYGHQGDYDYQGGQHHDAGYYGGGGQAPARNPQAY